MMYSSKWRQAMINEMVVFCSNLDSNFFTLPSSKSIFAGCKWMLTIRR